MILANLKKLRINKTTILIAHRISTIKDADKIIVIDDGKLVAIGKHDALMTSSPFYQQLVLQQQLEDEIEGVE